MANNFMDIVKKKLEVPAQLSLSASDRALLEQTCKGLEEIKQQRLSEAAALSELKELLQSNPEQFAEEIATHFSSLQSTFEDTAQETQKQNELTMQAIAKAQEIAETAMSAATEAQKQAEAAHQSAAKAQENAEAALSSTTKAQKTDDKAERRISSLIALCWFSLLATLGTMTLLVLNILGII